MDKRNSFNKVISSGRMYRLCTGIFYLIVILYGIALILHDMNLVGLDVENIIPSTYVIILTGAVASYDIVLKNKEN